MAATGTGPLIVGLRNLGLGLWERAGIFMKRVGGIIFALTVLLWFLSSFPAIPQWRAK